MQAPTDPSIAAFLAWEERQEQKYDYSCGRISLLPGGTNLHALLIGEVFAALHAALRATACRVYLSDTKLITETSVRYPDLIVSCDPRDTGNPGVGVRFPKLIVEVLSESTASVDRGEKLDEYLAIPTLEEYVLVDSRRMHVAAYRRASAGWIVQLPVTAGAYRFAAVDCSIDLDAAYTFAGATDKPQ